MWGPAIVIVHFVHHLSACLLHANISKTKRDRRVVTRKLEQEFGIPDSESVIRFTIGSTVPPIRVLSCRHFVHRYWNVDVGPVNGSVGTVNGLYVIWLRFCMIDAVERRVKIGTGDRILLPGNAVSNSLLGTHLHHRWRYFTKFGV